MAYVVVYRYRNRTLCKSQVFEHQDEAQTYAEILPEFWQARVVYTDESPDPPIWRGKWDQLKRVK